MENPRCRNIVRYEMLKRVGYFVTESSEHFAEYVPWFIKAGREDLIEKFKIPLDEYPARCINHKKMWQDEKEALASSMVFEVKQSVEYASHIMNAIWTGKPAVICGNVANDGLIDNLPKGCAVEVPCLVDRNGIQPTAVGQIPAHLAAIMQSNVSMQGLVVEALLTENRDRIYHAAMMDLHTGAELDLEQIWQLVDALLAEHRDWLPGWTQGTYKWAAE